MSHREIIGVAVAGVYALALLLVWAFIYGASRGRDEE